MFRNQVTKLWTALVTALLALCTTLGLITTTAAAAVPRSEQSRNTSASAEPPAQPLWSWAVVRALPPTMKQRIRAEAHGKTPSCRHRPPSDTEAEPDAACDDTAADAAPAAEPAAPLQR
ncbi:DUF6344 domain-containing protein [Streptomyces sp. NPDC090106]|uniref:DUF6344 domain-containing protein n=1 Tax=Streptomyces sp. NPDC090106 TaxID=3365946 RepID=UPI00381C6750